MNAMHKIRSIKKMDRPISLKPIVKEMINKIKDEAKNIGFNNIKNIPDTCISPKSIIIKVK